MTLIVYSTRSSAADTNNNRSASSSADTNNHRKRIAVRYNQTDTDISYLNPRNHVPSTTSSPTSYNPTTSLYINEITTDVIRLHNSATFIRFTLQHTTTTSCIQEKPHPTPLHTLQVDKDISYINLNLCI
ncbi:hypothetical protein DPMN_154322 [Dreissena polymorpha]|uniref:Uncharacterized protein n=1 Tax=Dreissena polymorpha TaxID=45954 RepID=A0A9D4FP02_DREPO|nr:hypothetical protein DPMN_154322 [Dreissena polymorpha]